MTGEPCMCGATDCPSCGPAQGYAVRRVWKYGIGYVYINPEDEDEDLDMSPEDDEAV